MNHDYDDLPIGYPRPVPQPLSGQANLIFKVAFGAFSIFLLVYSIGMGYNGLASEHWSLISARIIRSKVVSSPSSHGQNTYYPEVHYTFNIADQSLESSSVRAPFNDDFGFGTGSNFAHEIVARYPEGLVTQVYVDPLDTNNSCLIPGLNWIRFAICLTLGLAIASCLIPWRKSTAKPFDRKSLFVN
jgi:hypothetical protein